MAVVIYPGSPQIPRFIPHIKEQNTDTDTDTHTALRLTIYVSQVLSN